jgi:LysR family transcriptional regulator, glycine cleavage system transcriptional activator
MIAAGYRASTPFNGAAFEDFNLLRAAAQSGQGVALCASSMIRTDIKAGRLVQLSDQSVLDEYVYYMLIGPMARVHMPERVQAFRDWALAVRDA